MSRSDDEERTFGDIAPALIARLTERLSQHGLGEIEVRRGDLRVRVMAPAGGPTLRVAAPTHAPGSSQAGPTATTRASAGTAGQTARGTPAGHPSVDVSGVMSPAVGYFAYTDGLGPGLTVEKGDQLGYVEVLGVRHDVRAPRSGVIRNLVTEAGEAVEYGQLLVELEATPS